MCDQKKIEIQLNSLAEFKGSEDYYEGYLVRNVHAEVQKIFEGTSSFYDGNMEGWELEVVMTPYDKSGLIKLIFRRKAKG